MISDGQLDEIEFEELRGAIERNVHEVVEWAKAEPFPALESLHQDIYYEGQKLIMPKMTYREAATKALLTLCAPMKMLSSSAKMSQLPAGYLR